MKRIEIYDGINPEPIDVIERPYTQEESMAIITAQISYLERQQTPRRLREAALGVQDSIDFLQSLENQISDLRDQL